MNLTIKTLTLFSILVLSSCARPVKIDTSTDELFEKTCEKAADQLDSSDRERFEEAMMYLAFDEADLFQSMADPNSLNRKLKNRLHGKTALELIEEVEALKIEDEKQAQVEKQKRQEQKVQQHLEEQKQIISEILELESERSKAKEHLEKLKSFRIDRSRFYRVESDYQTKTIKEITATNNLSFPISRVYFHGSLTTPGRAIPWFEGDFNCEIQGGIEPGEQSTWKLSRTWNDPWEDAPNRSDMVFTVVTTKLEGPNNEVVYDGVFPEHKKERLTNLYLQLDPDSQLFASASNLKVHDASVLIVNNNIVITGSVINTSGKTIQKGTLELDWTDIDNKPIKTDSLPLNKGKMFLTGESWYFEFHTFNDPIIKNFKTRLLD